MCRLHICLLQQAARRTRGGFDEIKPATERKIVAEIKRTDDAAPTSASSSANIALQCRHCPNSLVRLPVLEYPRVLNHSNKSYIST